jgi:hypothetical protein
MSALRRGVIFMVITLFTLVLFFETLAPALVVIFDTLATFTVSGSPGSVGNFANIALVWIPMFFAAGAVLVLAVLVFRLARVTRGGARR